MNKSLILITRPVEGAHRLEELLRARGHACLIDPMLAVHPRMEAEDELRLYLQGHRVSGTIITSRHALPLLKRQRPLHSQPLYAVGAETANAAKHAGFANVMQAATALQLGRIILTHAPSNKGTLLYARGRDVSENLALTLHHQGFHVHEIVVYDALPSLHLAEGTVAALKEKTLRAATFLSARTAETFLRLAAEAGVTPLLADVCAVAYSEQVAAVLRKAAWRHIAVCPEPTLAAVEAAVDNLCPQE